MLDRIEIPESLHELVLSGVDVFVTLLPFVAVVALTFSWRFSAVDEVIGPELDLTFGIVG